MTDKKRILVVGSANMDLSLNVYRVPTAGETVSDDGGVAYVPGGKGANAAVALAKLGADSVLCAKLGRDLHGQQLYNYYKEVGVDTSYIKVDLANPTGFAVVMKEYGGQNRIILYPGANTSITRENIEAAFASSPDALYIGFEASFDTALTAARIAASRGIPIFLDAAPANKEHSLESLPPLEVFSPNESETYEYTGIMPSGADSSLRAALALYGRVKTKYVVIKQGERGSCIYDGKHFFLVPPMKPQCVLDTTGAGDTYTAALTLEYLRSGDIRAAAAYASAAAAIAVSRHGASGATPTADEVMRFISQSDLKN